MPSASRISRSFLKCPLPHFCLSTTSCHFGREDLPQSRADCVSDDGMRIFSFYFDFVGERLIREKTLSSGTDTFYLDVTGF